MIHNTYTIERREWSIIRAGLGTIVGAGLGTIVGAGLGNKISHSEITEQQNPPYLTAN
ncbi:glycine zipper family protein [Coleofasciculus sp. E1-EBD-02]|uniref:glycine zipper family protein n=1 Tax=unclassified Coleofasciculus TaxID=2692782 RepID=UPI0032F4173F